MNTINKKDKIFNKINDVFAQVINIDSPESITETIDIIKENMFNIDTSILEYWISETFSNKLADNSLLNKGINYKAFLVEKIEKLVT